MDRNLSRGRSLDSKSITEAAEAVLAGGRSRYTSCLDGR